MPTRAKLLILGCVLLCILATAGCGGGGGGDEVWSRSGSGTLSPSDPLLRDDTYYDTVTFKAPKNGNLTVSMNSSSFVTYVLVFEGTGTSTVFIDESVGYLTFYAEANVTYTVYLNSRDSLETGPYTWSVSYPGYYAAASSATGANLKKEARKLLN